jgi:hypothetical protein
MTRWYVLGLLSVLAPSAWLWAGAPAEPPAAPGDARGVEFFEK